ncbi:MAG: YceI family protein [Pseudomonadota bacterium]
MHRIAKLSLLMILSALAGCASLVTPEANPGAKALRSGDYALDQRHAALLFKIDHLGFSKYIGRFERFDASMTFSEDAPEKTELDVAVDVASLDVADDDFAETLIGPDWFDATAFPQAFFRVTSVTQTGEQTARVDGDLTLKGVTAPISLDATFNGGARDLLRGAYVVGFSAIGSFDRTTFGVDRFAGVISNTVEIEIEAEFVRK